MQSLHWGGGGVVTLQGTGLSGQFGDSPGGFPTRVPLYEFLITS